MKANNKACSTVAVFGSWSCLLLIISFESLASSVSRGSRRSRCYSRGSGAQGVAGPRQGQKHFSVHPEQRQPEWWSPSDEASEALDEVPYMVLIWEEDIINIKNDDFKSPKEHKPYISDIVFRGSRSFHHSWLKTNVDAIKRVNDIIPWKVYLSYFIWGLYEIGVEIVDAGMRWMQLWDQFPGWAVWIRCSPHPAPALVSSVNWW